MGRPNQFDPALLTLLRDAVRRGATVAEVADSIPEVADGRLSRRGLNYAALRLFRDGRLVRRFEVYGSGKADDPFVRQYRYWLPEYGPNDAESA
jgi:hypothetical protein